VTTGAGAEIQQPHVASQRRAGCGRELFEDRHHTLSGRGQYVLAGVNQLALHKADSLDFARMAEGSQESGALAGVGVNQRYFVHYVQQTAAKGATVLDYGCGDGTIVRLLRAEGYDAHGVDIHWPGAGDRDLRGNDLAASGLVRYFEEGGRLPFEDDFFDVVISNQVFEHVVPLEAAVREIARVVKPGGVSYHHFPSRSVLREGHIGIPLAHRLPPGRFRLYYTAALRQLGLGMFKDGRPAMAWAREKLDWIDRWTIYRPSSEIHAVFGRDAVLRHRELDYCRFRAGARRWLRMPLERPELERPAAALFRRLAFDAIELRPRRASSVDSS
jgi:SAM-dependent methyltransferase